MRQGLDRALQLGAITLLVGGLLGCNNLNKSGIGVFQPNVPIGKISEVEKERKIDSIVYLKGNVVKLIPFLEKRAYELKDSTGTILVITKDQFPEAKKELLIKGKVQYKSISLGGQDYGEVYVEEQERL